ncbi:MAG: pilus assembly protein [Ardenticatenales bacterium]|nr:pilus assembly protein [Ardenticatenales bacterium]
MKNPVRKKEVGQALVEFALVLPIILLIFTGIIDFGRMMFLYSQLSNAVREGARYGSVTGPNPNSPQFVNCTGIRNAVKGTLAIPIPDADLQVTITYDNGKTAVTTASGVAVTCPTSGTAPNQGLITLGDRVLVKGSTKFAFITPLVSSFGPINLTLTSARTILRGGTLITLRDVGN